MNKNKLKETFEEVLARWEEAELSCIQDYTSGKEGEYTDDDLDIQSAG